MTVSGSSRTALSKAPSRAPRESRLEFDDDGGGEDGRRCCGQCCAWVSMIVGCILLGLLFLLGMLSLSILRSSVPKFHIKGLNFTYKGVAGKDHRTTLLTAKISLMINATNTNKRHDLSYSSLKVDVSSAGIDLGSTKLSPFKQGPKEVTVLHPRTSVKKVAVDKEEAEDLDMDVKDKELTISVVLTGSINVNFVGQPMNHVPLLVLCEDIEQADIDNGRHANPLAVSKFSTSCKVYGRIFAQSATDQNQIPIVNL